MSEDPCVTVQSGGEVSVVTAVRAPWWLLAFLAAGWAAGCLTLVLTPGPPPLLAFLVLPSGLLAVYLGLFPLTRVTATITPTVIETAEETS